MKFTKIFNTICSENRIDTVALKPIVSTAYAHKNLHGPLTRLAQNPIKERNSSSCPLFRPYTLKALKKYTAVVAAKNAEAIRM